MANYWIAPSILSADFARLGEEVDNVLAAGADMVHFDVMDNHYVPNLTVGPLVCEALRKYGTTVPIDAHLMVKPVDRIIPDFAKAGATYITFHPEASEHIDRSLQLIRDQGCKSGLVFNPATPLDFLNYVLDKVDMILLMSVNPGFGGQRFIPATLGKLREARRLIDDSGYNIRLEIDGGVNVKNIREIAMAGADTFVAGSAIFNTDNYRATIEAMRAEPRRRGRMTMLDKVEAVFFDLDGTLVNSVPDLAVAVDTMMKRLGLPPRGKNKVSQWVGNGAEMLMRRALADNMAGDVPDELADTARPLFKAAYRENLCVHSYLYPGVLEGLDALMASGLRLACVTNKPTEFTMPLLEKIGIGKFFEVVLGGECTPHKKPAPDSLLLTAQRLGVDIGRGLMVGDSTNDVGAARNAGCPVVCVPYGYNHGEDIRDAHPDAVIDSIADLKKLLQKAT